MNRLKWTLPLVAVVVLTGCGDATNADLTGIPGRRPDKIEAYINIDGHPNLVRLCIGKVAFVTTSREAGENFMRVPEWDGPFCGAEPSASPVMAPPPSGVPK